MYETRTERCPIETYKIYSSKRPDDYCQPDHPFYLATNTVIRNPSKEQTWFLRGPVGKNKLNNLMKTMAEKAGLTELQQGKKITNTSVRKTLCQKLLEANVPDTQAIHITGHKNAASLNNYRRLNNQQQANLSNMLANKPPELPVTSTSQITAENPSWSLSQTTCSNVRNQATKNKEQPQFFPHSTIYGGTFNITINTGRKRRFSSSESENDSQ